MDPIVPCLWFDTQAEDAVAFYTAIFANSRVGSKSRYGPNAPLPEGTMLACAFFLDGQEFMAMNGGPMFSFTPAISMVRRCETQAEIDHFWDALLEGGGSPSRCGWLKDRFGVSWQVVPKSLGKLMSGPGAGRVMAAFMPMGKIELEVLERAARDD
jgi:predicted 3-demethylubiquinone-9 3-methyltransferase (glyoxalase superfamily)